MENDHPNNLGTMPRDSAESRSVRNDSESLGNIPKDSERKENHTLTVREVSRMFEVAGVARTERSIVNWCQRNALGVAKLDTYFDPNERKYFITPQSVEQAIVEEKAKAVKAGAVSENVGSVPNSSGKPHVAHTKDSETDSDAIRSLECEVRDLQITNRAKDMFIEQLRQERDDVISQLLTASRNVGELETKLLRLNGSVTAKSADTTSGGGDLKNVQE
jgi:hypothetical protein